ncbi:MAG: hypothetical protein ABSF69_07540 [Polyangiaceae bacterium]
MRMLSTGRQVLAVVLVGLLALSCVRLARALFPKPIGAVLPLAFCLMIGVEAIILNALGLVHGATPTGLAIAHVLFVAGVLLPEIPRKGGGVRGLLTGLRRALAFGWRSPVTPMVLPIFATLYFVAIVYPPNNGDSMTYHLARVVHWMQDGSVAFVPTSDSRENVPGPGAEYLVLLWQSLTGSERFANTVQTTAFVVVVVWIATVARYLRAPPALRLPLVMLFATVPSFLLEATTEQNDLCAAVAALAVVTALRNPLFGATPRLGYRDGVALGLAIGASYLVKGTGLVFVLPLLGCAAARLLRAALVDPGRQLLRWGKVAATALSVGVVVAGPHLLRKAVSHGLLGPIEMEVTFPLSSFGLRRFGNPLFAFAHHVPVDGFNAWLQRVFDRVSKTDPPNGDRGGTVDGFYAGYALTQEEDLAGAPIQFAATWLFSIIGGVWAARRRAGANAALATALLPLAGWVIFHWVVRNQVWIARYHSPWFAMAPLSAWGVCRWARESASFRKVSAVAVSAAAVLGVAYGWSTLVANPLRPVTTATLATIDRTHSQYFYEPKLEWEHPAVLKVAADRRCATLILGFLHDNISEYQLTWRAYERGIRVYHFPGPEDGCLLYAPDEFDDPHWRHLEGNLPSIYVPR